jgi:hypothetical protein
VSTRNAPRLREAIELYLAQHNEELDENARKLLKRLANSDEAAEAFEQLKAKEDNGEAADDDEEAIVRARQYKQMLKFLNRLGPEVIKYFERLKPRDRGKAEDAQAVIIRACILTENLARTFPQRLKKLEERLPRKREERLARLKWLGNATTTLRALLKQIISEQQKPLDPLVVRGPETDEEIEAMGRGLALFERRIFFERDLVGRNLSWLKVTRKGKTPSKTLSAGQIAAMKWFAEEVKRVTGKAHEDETRKLLKVLLGMEVSPEQARYARRADKHWHWMALSLPEKIRKAPKVARSRPK